MGMEDAESCSSTGPVATPRRDRLKYDVYTKVLRRVRDQPEALLPGFAEDLWAHFSRLPPRYSIDFNVDRAEDVFTHMKLLKLAVDPANRPVFHIKVVQASSVQEGVTSDSASSNPPGEEHPTNKTSVHPMPMFGSSSNLEALALESREPEDNDGLSVSNGNLWSPRPMHEITFSADDRPKMLSQLTSLLGELGLNIQEAHAFSTNDGYSLDAFVVQGWRYEETEQLEKELQLQIQKTMPLTKPCSLPNLMEQVIPGAKPVNGHVKIPTDGSDVWEINFRLLKIENKVASGSYSDLYKGTYLNQDVAIKVLAPERVNAEMQREFCQEVFIMRKVRHKNVVQFIGACTKPPLFCIVTEFMAGGSVYDFLHKNKGVLNLSSLIRIATDISRGMNYLHQNNIIHRDLKAANLLIDEHQLVKVADFGVARVKSRSGIMTAETGTYRWMAPEVIEHKPYDHKADVFSFAIVLWELLTRQIPYEQYTPLQAAVGVVQKGLRPTIPEKTHPKLSQLLQRCWEQDPSKRPDFSEIIKILQQLAKEVKDEPDSEGRLKEKSSGRFLAALRRSH